MIDNHLDRLEYTFKNRNKINLRDVEALNGVIDYVNTEKERQCLRNDLFVKLAISILKQDIIKSGGNDKLAMSNLRSICNIDLEDSLNRFVMEVNQAYLEQSIKENGIEELEDYPKWDKENLKTKMIEVLSNLLDNC